MDLKEYFENTTGIGLSKELPLMGDGTSQLNLGQF